LWKWKNRKKGAVDSFPAIFCELICFFLLANEKNPTFVERKLGFSTVWTQTFTGLRFFAII
ncbi:MAG: hypothetical protein IJY28_08295, partial [Clostridia bacterium]|nr:hypothetical protein [Clostridia bacterium]